MCPAKLRFIAIVTILSINWVTRSVATKFQYVKCVILNRFSSFDGLCRISFTCLRPRWAASNSSFQKFFSIKFHVRFADFYSLKHVCFSQFCLSLEKEKLLKWLVLRPHSDDISTTSVYLVKCLSTSSKH